MDMNENTIGWEKKSMIKTTSEMCCECDEGQNDVVFTFETFWMNPVGNRIIAYTLNDSHLVFVPNASLWF